MKGFIDNLPSLPVMVGAGIVVAWFAGYGKIVSAIVVVGIIIYVYACVEFPWAKCPPQVLFWGGCGATGEQWWPFSKKHFRICHKCGGTRKVVRLGRRIWTFGSDVNEDRK